MQSETVDSDLGIGHKFEGKYQSFFNTQECKS